ncbi:hypothetical protein HY995_01130, partial [Candidatus Micrarchaeota archaeon]|nr:hypothetical protein [Candidatus Micrarchaeota archaeon]
MRWNLLVVLALFGAVAVQANLPDLTLTASPSTAWAALGRQAVFSVRVSNFGNSFSGRTQLAATFPDGLSVSPSLSSVPALLAGRSAAFSFTVTCVKQGAYSPSFVVDPRNSIAELNENNNAASVSVTCGELPDLGVAITPRASQPLSYDEAAAFNVTTLNFGRVNAGQSATVVAYSGFTGGLLIQPSTPAYLPIAQLAPGGKSLAQFKLTCRIPGVYFLNAYADIAKAVRESNENNNDDGVKVTCAGFPDLNATISPRANLTLSYDKANLFNVTTLNFGKSPAGQSATLVDYSGPKEGLWILPLTPAYLPVPRLAPGANSVSGLYVTCRLPGVYSLFGLADVKNVVRESNELNNNDTLVLNCANPPSPDLVSRISPRSQSAFVGQVVPVVLTTSNVGNG